MTVTHPGAPTLTAALDCFFVRPGDDERARTTRGHVLGRVTYGPGGRPPLLHDGAPLVRIAMAGDGTERITEVWTSVILWTKPPPRRCATNCSTPADRP